MPRISLIVEGDGEVDAVPSLLTKILRTEQMWDWFADDRPIRVGNPHNLKRKLEQYLRLAAGRKDCAGILILLDLDEGCPVHEARALADQVRELQLPYPVAIVLAYREYETWFLASLDTVVGQGDLPAGLVYQGDVEARRGVKEWLQAQMPAGRGYKETVDQRRFTALIDLDLAAQRSRSFRRLLDAVEELVQVGNVGQPGYVTPP